ADVVALQRRVRQVRVDETLSDYILDLADATRNHADLYLGASPRASLALYRAAQALALVKGRDYVVPDDIKWLAPAVLTHRLLTKGFRQGERSQSAAVIVAELLDRTPVPA